MVLLRFETDSIGLQCLATKQENAESLNTIIVYQTAPFATLPPGVLIIILFMKYSV